jgi:hypothetical protein
MRFPELQITVLTIFLAYDPAATGLEVRELQYHLRRLSIFGIPRLLVTAPGHEEVRGAVIEPEFGDSLTRVSNRESRKYEVRR